MLEHTLNARITEELDQNHAISENQHGFRKGKSTATALEQTIRFIENTLKRGARWTPAIILLDIRNAFNCASWKHIIEKTKKTGISPYLVQIIASYLSDRNIQIAGKKYPLSGGVPQGSVLGPTLWNILINDVTNIDMPDCSELTLYADDLALLVAAKDDREMTHRGNLGIKRIQKWTQEHDLEIAGEKTQAIIVRGRRTAVSRRTNFAINDTPIIPQNHLKYLGVWLDESINFQNHATKTAEAATKAINCLGAILSRPTVRMARRRIIASVVEAKLLYGCEVWAKRMPGCAFKTLESTQRKAAIKIIQGFQTISTDAALVLAGMIPIKITAEARWTRFQTGTKVTETVNLQKWQNRWDNSENGSWTRQLIPQIKNWKNRRHGELTYEITQFLSNHGKFKCYLNKMNRSPDMKCVFCKQPENARHVLFNCAKWENQRTKLLGQIGPEDLIMHMTESTADWEAVSRLMERMLSE